jgi:hypothetical protein
MVGFVLEKNCIFLKDVESLSVCKPILSKLEKLIRFELSLGDNITWAGVDDKCAFLLFWWYFHNVLDLEELELKLKYFSDFPTTVE